MPQPKENITVINVFSIANKGGNPCVVVDNAQDLRAKEMQALATRLNFPETVFILRKRRQILLRFFATKKELPICYHGALGAAFYLHKLSGSKEIDLASYLELTHLKIQCGKRLVTLSIPHRRKSTNAYIDIETIKNLLNIDESCIEKSLPCSVFSIGNSKLFVPIKDRARLFSIEPNLGLICNWCKEQNINGIYAYSSDTAHVESDFVGRNFNPLFSHQEDIATGTAAAALCQMISLNVPLIDYTFTIEQGANLNSPSKITVSVTENTIEIKGYVYFPKNESDNTRNNYAN
ncbi:MAG: PhzF family phenazine biosynthesis protein [Rickettsia endosymbiont of Ixodes persulcatus]|nr:PhzF family phenazine biosynthesis protein [Rickettsia endosymbiont of Ixodes persulcatus]